MRGRLLLNGFKRLPLLLIGWFERVDRSSKRLLLDGWLEWLLLDLSRGRKGHGVLSTCSARACWWWFTRHERLLLVGTRGCCLDS